MPCDVGVGKRPGTSKHQFVYRPWMRPVTEAESKILDVEAAGYTGDKQPIGLPMQLRTKQVNTVGETWGFDQFVPILFCRRRFRSRSKMTLDQRLDSKGFRFGTQ